MLRPLALAAVLAASAGAAERRPNIVLVLADDFGYENLACNGGGSFQTPQLDRLAAEGVRFTGCHAQPLCTPSRVQLMTGQYNFRNYVGFGKLKPGSRTIGNTMQEAGYATAMVGKWQLAGDAETPGACGFRRWQLWQLFGKTERYWDPVELWQDGRRLPDRPGAYGPDLHQAFALDFVAANRARPFFLYYAHTLTHDPFHHPPSATGARPAPGGGVQAQFAGMVSHFDRQMGELAAHLRNLGLERDTLLLITGDNGNPKEVAALLDGQEVKGGKGRATRLGTHVPLIAWWPGTARPRVCDDLVDLTDFLPTCAEIAGATAAQPCDGRSFLPQVRGGKGSPRETVFGWYDVSDRGGMGRDSAVWVQDGRHALYGDGRLADWLTDGPASGPAAEAARPRLEQALAALAPPPLPEPKRKR